MQTSRPPKYSFPWNGELSPPADDSAPNSVMLYPAKFVCSDVTVKRIPAACADGAGIDHSLELSGSRDDGSTLSGGFEHVLRTWTCQHGRPGDDGLCYYVAMETCDFNLGDFVREAQDATRRSASIARKRSQSRSRSRSRSRSGSVERARPQTSVTVSGPTEEPNVRARCSAFSV